LPAENPPDPDLPSRTENRREPRGRHRTLLVVAAAVAVLAVVYVVAALVTSGRLPREATVAGIEVGGKSPAAAATIATTTFAERLDAPLRLTAGAATLDTTAADAGIRFDADATFGRSGRTFDPGRILHTVFGSDTIDPVFTLDRTALDAALAPLAERADVKPADGGVTFVDGKVVVQRAVAGHVLDTGASGAAILAAVTTTGARPTAPVALPGTDREPTITQAAVDRAVKEFAAPAVSAPVRVKVGPTTFNAAPATFSTALSMRADGGALQPVVDAAALRTALADQLAKAETKPTSARITIRDGKPVIVGGTDGVSAPTQKLASAMKVALTKSGDDRLASVDVVTTPSKHSRAALAKLGVKEKVSSFTTRYPYAAYRNQNIGRGAELVDGTLLDPGDTFSLNGIVGERTKANGFTDGFVIEGGRLRKDLGGGVSQLATTLYNAGFFAGLDDVEHRAHAFYINRYPAGREATVYWGSIDMRFRNNTPYGVYVQAHLDKGAPGRKGVLTVTLWSTKYWEVTTASSDRYSFRAPARIVDSGSGCEVQEGSAGFDIDITRWIARNGTRVKTEKYTTRYSAEDSVTCTG
jgi:vancomycin resistance protein YoaR